MRNVQLLNLNVCFNQLLSEIDSLLETELVELIEPNDACAQPIKSSFNTILFPNLKLDFTAFLNKLEKIKVAQFITLSPK